ncbi:phage terminase large subunit [Halomonas sp. ATCH28]|uniref:Phage terminase large subunit n=1 Tax=Halomonas gemina TaxID=2945105 RepID=A0ABT0T627_9GAMM|nr:phage terminase large subunit [Halomonas gemina]MCL7942233.1 phage terminase large subunit [Halomonas gemina]
MAKRFVKSREYKFHLSQEELSEIPIHAPLSKKQEMYTQEEDATIVVMGGAAASGKTQTSIHRIFLRAMNDPHYVCTVLRHNKNALTQGGSFWETIRQEWEPYGVSFNGISNVARFPNGAFVKLHYIDNNKSDFQSMQCSMHIEEGAELGIQESDVVYLISRLRGKSKYKPQLTITCNPEKDSYMRSWLEKGGYLTEDGFPKKEMDGKTTYFLQKNGAIEFFQTRKEIEDLYGKETSTFALPFVFISGNVDDNPYILKHDPQYRFNLLNMERVEKEKLYDGNWLASSTAEGYAKREYFREIALSDIPLGLPTMRAWDFAASKPSEASPNPDASVGIKCSYDKSTGDFYILDMVKLKDRSAVVEQALIKAAKDDGTGVYVSIPVDPGAAGKHSSDLRKARLMSEGSKVVLSKTRGSKLSRAEPFLLALQEGKVHILKDVFDQETYTNIENFTGKRNKFFDDEIDSLSDCYNNLVKGNLIPSIKLPNKDNARLRSLGGSTLL